MRSLLAVSAVSLTFVCGASAQQGTRLDLTHNASIRTAGFDTGIAISNPKGPNGTFNIHFYPNTRTGDILDFAPWLDSATLAENGVGQGLQPDGTLLAGSSYTVLVSELLALLEHVPDFDTESFVGRIEIETTFPEGKAVNFLSDSRGNSQGFSASPVSTGPPSTSSAPALIHTFWGTSSCPAIEGMTNISAIGAKVWSMAPGGGGFMCGGTGASGPPFGASVPLVAVAPSASNSQLDCVVCVYR